MICIRVDYFNLLFRSTDSDTSEVTATSGHVCQIKRITSFSRPQRFFTLSQSRKPVEMDQLNVPCEEAKTPTNLPISYTKCSTDIPTILLIPPDSDEAKTPTPDKRNFPNDPFQPSDNSSVNLTSETKDRKYFGEDFLGANEMAKEKEQVIKDEETSLSKVEGVENDDRLSSQSISDGREVVKEDTEEDETTSHTFSTDSHESLTTVASPFGDAAKMSFFSSLEPSRSNLGILDLQLSSSMTSILVPPTGNPPVQQCRSSRLTALL